MKLKKILASILCIAMVFGIMGISVFADEAPKGTLTNVYTSESTYWGECGGNAKESFEFKFYNDDTYMGYTSLNNVDGIIDGDVYVSWHIKLDAESNTDEYWNMAWEIAPTVDMQPNRVEQWVDGVKVAECEVEPNWSDRIFPIVAAVTDDNGKILSYVNNKGNATLANAVAGGGNIVLLEDKEYSIGDFNFGTVTIKAAEGVDVVFEVPNRGNSLPYTDADANVTFENITFDYYPNGDYNGLQYNTVKYNNCTINGQIFLYAYTSDIFNKCTFNQNSSNAYNVWTYGAKAVEFNDCTFNSAGKSVFVYNEGGNGTALKVDDCEFNASAVVEGKAAIEIDSSLLKEGMAFDIDVENSTAIGFDNGSMSGNSLWNNKKGDKEEVTTQNSTTQTALSAENNSTTVTYGEKPVDNVEKADGTVFVDATDAKKWCAYKFEITPTGNSITVEVASEKGELTSEPKPIANIDKATTVVIGVTATGVNNLTSIAVTTE